MGWLLTSAANDIIDAMRADPTILLVHRHTRNYEDAYLRPYRGPCRMVFVPVARELIRRGVVEVANDSLDSTSYQLEDGWTHDT